MHKLAEGSDLARIIGCQVNEQQMMSARVLLSWSESAGEHLSLYTKAVSFKNNNLLVIVSDHSYLMELTYLREKLKKKLNQKLGTDIIQNVFFKYGTFDISAGIPPIKKHVPYCPPQREDSAVLEERVEKDILPESLAADPGIRKSLFQLMRTWNEGRQFLKQSPDYMDQFYPEPVAERQNFQREPVYGIKSDFLNLYDGIQNFF